MRKIYCAFVLFFSIHVHAQLNQRAMDSIRKLTETDYRTMLAQLKIDSIRQGANGNNPNAPNAANYDESKANPFPVLPDPLVLKNGKRVKDANTWWKERRPEIVEDFDREIYGRMPLHTPQVNWEVMGVYDDLVGDIPAITKRLSGHVDNSSFPSVNVDIQLTLTTPAFANGPVPVMMEFSFVFPPGFRPQGAAAQVGPTWQQQVLSKGWGYAILIPTSIQADNGAGLTQGIIGLMNKGQRRKPDEWGALRAWAWGASRALDYFETDKSVDAKQVGIEGLSRYGKATVVTMAYDPRFAIAFIASSGEGGVKLHRRNAGEIVENVASSGEYHWMAGNFIKYAGPLTWNDLPVDSHELVALCAPRPVFISAGDKGDGWVDVKGMFLAGVAATPVYELLGKKGLSTSEFPKVETSLTDGEVAWRQHSAGHTAGPNWPYFLQFADRYIHSKSKIVIPSIAPIKGLKDYYKNYFPIGVAVSPRSLKTDEAQLILQQFNSITPENAMKMGPIHPTENEYYWKDADSIVAFAKRNGIKIRGHNLCWHNQAPRWFFTDSTGKQVSKEVLLQRLKEHITTVVSRYKGTIYAWDVVNEVISDKPGEYFRNSEFYKICGEEFVAKAFQYAHEADPDALLFYNDYNEINPEKREKIFRLVKSLKDAGVPIHGIGMQGHWAINEPSRGQLDSTIKRFAELGLKIQVTELDISVYPKEHNARERKPEDANTAFTTEKENRQMEMYRMCFEVFRKYRNVISGVTFWNISDRRSWLDDFPVRGRKDYPLLFDKDLKPKKAFWKVVKF